MKGLVFDNLVFDGDFEAALKERAAFSCADLSVSEEISKEIHASFVEAGADVVRTGTACVNPLKYRTKYRELIQAEVKAAKNSGARFTALTLGALGKKIGADGISFDTACAQYKKIIAAAEQTDFIFVKVNGTLAEARAAILTAKENSRLPVILSVSLCKESKNSAECFALVAEGLGVAAFGAECDETVAVQVAEKLLSCTSLPVFIEIANPDENLSDTTEALAALGISVLGGGKNALPSDVATLKNKQKARARAPYKYSACVCSDAETVNFDTFKLIGGALNPLEDKLLKRALVEQDFERLTALAEMQVKNGADLLLVNCSSPEINESAALEKAVELLQNTVSVPLVLNASSPSALENALRKYNGKALVNVDGTAESLGKTLPVAAKYGAAVIGAAYDEHGVPGTAAERLKTAKRIMTAAKKAGIKQADVFIDAVVMPETSEKGNAAVTLETVRSLSGYGIKTVLCISDASFGARNRQRADEAFLALAKTAGLSAAVLGAADFSAAAKRTSTQA